MTIDRREELPMLGGHRWGVLGIGACLLSLLGVGCHHTHPEVGPRGATAPIAVPPPGTVPVELQKIMLPPYVIEAPDQLLIEVIQRAPVEDPVTKVKTVQTVRLPVQPISGPFQVRLDGTVGLGFWGPVPVSGLTMEQAAEAIRKHVITNPVLRDLGTKPESVVVILDVLAYNSKRYYVIFDGGGFGEQVISFPITGSETVLDAIANVGGISDVGSKRNMWVARRTPHPGQPWQILPIDWVGLTQHGQTCTNYQILPGDRIYVKAQKLVTIDRTLTRIFAPIERVFGITLLGASTVNQISGRGLGNNIP
ncbi:MAG: polysaccharide biosynthesis/export family protein [Planctomycetes bacterium]|nr:polysaccharide biosynthesis/export family protein [Planctomycetota bacterium]